MTDITVRYAEGDADTVAIHAFLCVTMGPLLPCPIDPKDSATEVWRVVNHDCAVMALRGDTLVGTIGLIQPKWWFGHAHYLTNRWFAALPGLGAGRVLLREAEAIGKSSKLEVVIIDETKGRITILNKSPDRKSVNPYLVRPSAEPTHEISTTIQ